MKRTLTTICAVAAFGGLIITSEAQSTVLSEDFDSLPAGTYGNAYNFSDFSSSAASSIVSPGEGGVGQAFQLTFNVLTNSGNLNCGSDMPLMALSGNTSANLADYTLSFDLARIGTGGGYFIAFNTFNEGSAPGSGTGVEYDIFGVPASGAGYQHFSVNMDTLNPTYGASAKLDPTGSQVYFELVALGFPPNAPSSPETLLLDNVKITMVPEPSTFAMLLGGLGLLAGWRRLRRAS